MNNTVRSIKSISVRKLFGVYDYSLTTKSDAHSTDKLLILYGDNGSGKTTILKSLFHLLAPDDGEGHKTQIARVPFQRFEITFNTGDKVWAQRTDSRLTGTFEMGLRMGRKKERRVEFTADASNVAKATSAKHNLQIEAFLKALRAFDVSLYLLSDDRTVQLAGKGKNNASIPTFEIHEQNLLLFHDIDPNFHQGVVHRPMDAEGIAQALLAQSLKRAESWIQTQVLRSSSIGESSVNSLYSEILKRLAKLPVGETLQPDSSRQSIEDRARRLEVRSREYAKYGLVPEFNGKDIAAALSTAAAGHIPIIRNVLSPYLESVEKKLDAMERIHRQIDTFVRVINSFFTHKTISFEVHKGFELRTELGRALVPQALSSGERHLLLLFCNTLVALERPSIFIIDEPEISLNIKWQRKLLSSLLECVGENPVQYVFATHSLELLARHRGNVLRLDGGLGNGR